MAPLHMYGHIWAVTSLLIALNTTATLPQTYRRVLSTSKTDSRSELKVVGVRVAKTDSRSELKGGVRVANHAAGATFPIFYAILMRNHCIIIGNVVCTVQVWRCSRGVAGGQRVGSRREPCSGKEA